MTKYLVILFSLFLTSILTAQSGISTQKNFDVDDLVKNTLIKGNCRNVSNIIALGNDSISIGKFDNGNNTIGLSSGIILSTGDIDLAQGPNISSEASFAFNASAIDEDIDVLATGELFDVTGIEFDFVPLNDNVSFNYVFASEEYCEFVGTSFNDVFGFFVSGPGINGTFQNNAINVASLINTNQDVSINNINHLQNQEFYIDNVTNLDAEACNIESNPAFEDFIEFDGFTVPLKASFSVIPCETYHIRLIIADVGDANLDSAVFLEANSFDLGEQVNLFAEVPGRIGPFAHEDCSDAQFVFTRSALSNLDEDIIVDYNISSDSKAINGLDFIEIPMSITIPAGDTSFILPIEIINDGILEGPENLKLNIPYDCDCIDPVFNELIINDPVSLSANFDDIEVCENQTFSISPSITGGVSPFSFNWNNGSQMDTLESTVTEATEILVTVTDFCANTSLAIADIKIQSTPTAFITGVYDICESSENGIPVQLEGNPPWSLVYSINGIDQAPIENIESNVVFLEAAVEGIYSLSAFNDAYCEGNVGGEATVETEFIVELEISPPSCIKKSDGKIEIVNLDVPSPYSLNWNVDSGDDFLIENLAEGLYVLSILDASDCYYEKHVDLKAETLDDCSLIYIPNVFSPDMIGGNDSFGVFYAEETGLSNVISLQIFDRWGSLLFEKFNFLPESGTPIWDGRFKNKALGPGVYVYKITIQFADGEEQTLSSDITLIR